MEALHRQFSVPPWQLYDPNAFAGAQQAAPQPSKKRHGAKEIREKDALLYLGLACLLVLFVDELR